MKCKVCNKEIESIKLNEHYCPNCGSDLLNQPQSEEEKEELLKVHNWSTSNRYQDRSDMVLTFGILTFVSSFFISTFTGNLKGYVSLIGIILGTLAIIFGIRPYKRNKKNRKAFWGIVLSGVGLLLAVTNLISFVNGNSISLKADEKYSSELGIELPNIKPSFYYNDESMMFTKFHHNEYWYQLEDAENFENQINNDNRWKKIDFTEEFIAEFDDILDLTMEGSYLTLNRKTNKNELPYNFEAYDFVIVLYNPSEKQITIYDVWKNGESNG